MKNKNLFNLLAVSAITASIVSCKKEECHECHYDKGTEKIELGEKCGKDLERLEADGYTDATGTYTAHCHEH
jgi:hypothetical protein